jgi:hypothetical protein
MRLTPIEQQVIREASLRNFGVRPRLQGVEARLHRVADIWKALGERKIDVVVDAGGEPLPIFEVAQREGTCCELIPSKGSAPPKSPCLKLEFEQRKTP